MVDRTDTLKVFVELVEPRGPAVHEFASALGRANSVAFWHLGALEAEGLITANQIGGTRGRYLTPRGRAYLQAQGVYVPEWLVPAWLR